MRVAAATFVCVAARVQVHVRVVVDACVLADGNPGYVLGYNCVAALWAHSPVQPEHD